MTDGAGAGAGAGAAAGAGAGDGAAAAAAVAAAGAAATTVAAAAAAIFIYEIEATVDAAPVIFGRYLVTLWCQQLAAADAFRADIGYNLDDKAVFPPANYHLLRRYRNPVRSHHLPSGDNYAALILNWICMHRSCTLSCVHVECMSTYFAIKLLFNVQNSDNILLKYECQIFLFT